MTEAPASDSRADRTGSGRPELLSLRELTCSFGGVKALDSVSIEIRRGEVQALLGENGSGKSTLAKILAGFYSPDSGSLTLRGEEVSLPLEAGEFRRLGISFVHQNLGLIGSMTAIENLRVGMIAEAAGLKPIRWASERDYARRLFADFGVDIEPDAMVEDLTDLDRARLAIVRAAEELRTGIEESGLEGGLLVLDEPTVFLPREAVGRLFELVREIVARGVSVLFVSHDLDEVLEIADRVTVLRDGRKQGTFKIGETTKERLVSAIIGRDPAELSSFRESAVADGVGVEVEGLTGDGVDGVSFRLRRGEVLGLTGLIGSGFDRVPYLLFGAAEGEGLLKVTDTEFDIATATIEDVMEGGVILVPGDREKYGCSRMLTVEENITLPVLSRYFERGRLELGRMDREVADHLATLEVRPPLPDIPVGALSGGNQQKVVMAKFLQMEPRLLLLHEPTQGVDVGAREQIFKLINREAGRGASVLCASTDAEQLAAICDRVLVFSDGRIDAELSGAEVEKERISRLVYRDVG